MRTLSYSQTNMFSTCPWRWYASYILKLPRPPNENFAIGRAVHVALASYWLGNEHWGNLLRSSLDKELADVELEIPPSFGKDEIQKADLIQAIYSQSFVMVNDLIELINRKFKQIKTEKTEQKYKKVGFIGYVDWVGKLDNVDYIIDWKTSNKPYYKNRAQEDDQLTCYAALTGIRHVGFGVMPKDGSPPQILLSVRTLDQISGYWDKVDEIRKEMEEGPPYKAKENRFCDWCDFQSVCPKLGDF